jgi:hypothetical protein
VESGSILIGYWVNFAKTAGCPVRLCNPIDVFECPSGVRAQCEQAFDGYGWRRSEVKKKEP